MNAKNNKGDEGTHHRKPENISYSSYLAGNNEPVPYVNHAPATRNILFGALWILVGGGIGWYLMEEAVQGQSFVLPIVVMVFGIVQLCKGIGQLFTSTDEW